MSIIEALGSYLLLAATAGCTAVAVMYGGTDVYWAMGILWAVALLIALTAWGTGHALSHVYKLKKKLEQLEYRSKHGKFDTEAKLPSSVNGVFPTKDFFHLCQTT